MKYVFYICIVINHSHKTFKKMENLIEVDKIKEVKEILIECENDVSYSDKTEYTKEEVLMMFNLLIIGIGDVLDPEEEIF